MLRYHAGWNFALNRQLGDELFHPTTRVHFRQRLLEQEQSALGFKIILDALAQAGLVSRQSRQRLDSTQMFGLVSRMSRLDCVRESLRLALQELETLVAPEARPEFWLGWWERYVESQTDYRAGGEALARKLVEAGTDTARLLEWAGGQARDTLAPGPQLKLLERVFQEQFEITASPIAPKGPGELSSDRVRNPHDPEATCAVKGEGKKKKEHVGYKVPVAETVTQAELGPGEPTSNFITGQVTSRLEWGQDCQECPLRAQGIGPGPAHRTLVVGEHHTVLQARRKEQKTEAFGREMKHRNAIEGTQSEWVRAHGLRRARYRGLAKARLQNYFAAAACNVKRWIRRKVWEWSPAQVGTAPAVS